MFYVTIMLKMYIDRLSEPEHIQANKMTNDRSILLYEPSRKKTLTELHVYTRLDSRH